MTEYFIQEQQLSNVTRTLVKNEDGKSLYLLVGRWGSRGDALSLYTMSGELVASIKQVSFIFGAHFDLYSHFEKVGTLKKVLHLSSDFYYIKQLNWSVIGDIYNHHYQITQNNREIMTMNKALLFTGNYFCLDVQDEQNAPLCICIAAVLDYWLYNKDGNKKKKPKASFNWSTC